IEYLGSNNSGGDARAQRADTEVVPLFIGPNDDFQWMARWGARFAQRADHFDGPERAYVAIVVAAMHDGINVRAEENDRQVLRTVTMAEDVASGIDANDEAGVFHQSDDVFACGHVCLGVAEAGDASLGIAAVLAKLGQARF